ncbi:MAG TPA: SLC13 family permease [Magnetospirillaceae bacterium]|nr:SLC13 family permease [Magnetospirillaceae bacterium]
MRLFILTTAAVMYVLVVAFPHRKAAMSLSASALILGAGLLFPGPGAVSISRAFLEFVNWTILGIYIGSLIIADLFIYSRVPAALADRVVAKSPTLGIAIVAILVLTGLISAFVENVATVLLMAPIALTLCRRLNVQPAPFLIGLAVMANLQGTATLVGDSPSMIFASFAGYGFNDFFFMDGRPSIFFAVQAGAVTGALYFFLFFRKLGKVRVDLPAERIISWFPLGLLISMISGLALISFLSGRGLTPASGMYCLSLGAAGLVWFRLVRKEPAARVQDLIRRLDWETILFLAGVFIVVGSIAGTGVLDDLASWLGAVIGGRAALGFVAIVGISVLVSGFVDNVPYITVMLPVAGKLSAAYGLEGEFLMFGLLVGSCLGGNLTPFGASANIAAVGLVKKAGGHVGFFEWLRIAGPFTFLTTVVSSLFIYLVWG